MTRKHLFDDIKQNPMQIYRTPGDVLRDRRFSDVERLEILQGWKMMGDHPNLSDDIAILIAELERRMTVAAHGHAAE